MTIPFYVGTYTSDRSQGIYRVELDTESGHLTRPVLALETPNPTFVAAHPEGGVFYTVSESRQDGQRSGSAVRAARIESASGKLQLLNEQPAGGPGPCYVSVNPAGTHLFVANYAGGSAAIFPLREDGRIEPASSCVQHGTASGAVPDRQEAPHVHSINPDPAEKFALVADLGADSVYVYRFDSQSGSLAPADPPRYQTQPGAGPRHLAFHRLGTHQFVYLINELNGTVAVLQLDQKSGELTRRQVVSTLPDGYAGANTAAEVAVHPSGRFVYGSNRGHESIVVYAVDPETGLLTFVDRTPSGGEHPRHFAVDPTGNFLVAANRDTDNLCVFQIDSATGTLAPTAGTAAISRPVCVRFLP